MQRFVLLFVGRSAPAQAQDPETQAYFAKWSEWMDRHGAAGTLKAGGPFAPGGKHVERDAVSELVLDDVGIGGYAIVEADSIDEAIAVGRDAPHIALGGATLVRPCLPGGGG